MQGVTLQSQRRYVGYYEKVLHEGPREPPTVLRLDRIRMHTIPDFKIGGGSGRFCLSTACNVSSFVASLIHSLTLHLHWPMCFTIY
jgi:hypothetical protein